MAGGALLDVAGLPHDVYAARTPRVRRRREPARR